MAGTNSDYTENKAVDHILGTTSWTMPAAVSLALFTVNPNFETGAGGTEATGGSYARKAIAFTAASGGATSNSAEKKWTVGTDIAAGTYTGWGVYDAASGGNLLFGDTFSSSKVLTGTGDTLTFAAGAITYSLT
jgi:predicted 2-oxoglutarate/Fe(II)-dependent dioxygenase YbiX